MPDEDPMLGYPFFTGIRNDIAPEEFGLGDLADAVNVDIDDEGKPKTREGSILSFAATGVHSLWSGAGIALFVQDGVLYEFLGASARRLMEVGPGRMAYASHAGRVYCTNGNASIVVENGQARRWGIVPPGEIRLAATGGNLPRGKYLVTATYITADGRESGAPRAAEIDAEGGIIVEVEPSTDPHVVACIVYATTANGETLYEIGASGTGSLRYTDAVAGRPLDSQFFGPPPAGTDVAIYRGVAFVAHGQFVSFSAPFDLERFRPDQYIAFDSAVTMVAATRDGLFVGTERETLWLAGNSPTEVTIEQRHASGAVAGTLAQAPAGDIRGLEGEFLVPTWLSTDGMCAGLPGGVLLNLTPKWSFKPPASGASMYRDRRLTTVFHEV